MNSEIIGSNEDHTLVLGQYAQEAYLAYAMSVVKGRALPDVADGQKPVQRRILYAMKDMGLAHESKPVKSARVVGEILGKYHPHGDTSAYDAMVRMAQDFTLRYPLIEGIGNFGSRDGDSAAAMRYTEARLTPLAELLLSELSMGTVDFVANYDGAFTEPAVLPARLPMVLLNGASGIAVGLATEIPSHNLFEVSKAAVALLKQPELDVAAIMQYIPGPDFAGGGQIITTAADLCTIYTQGKGSIRVRARYEIEKLARGQWRVVVTELPPGTSAQKIMASIEEQTNPKPKSGKKNLTQEQQNTRSLMLSLLDKVRDESDSQSPVRLVFEPKSSRLNPEELMNTLMVQTALETNVPVNLVMMGQDNKPAQKNLVQILHEWLAFRIITVTRRLNYRLEQVQKRMHILEGRQTVFLHIDEVIRVIRESDDPKAELIATFALSEVQADDILDIRLRQLARLEWLKLEAELKKLQEEEAVLQHLLTDEKAKKRLIIKEIETDAKTYGDARRTLIQAAQRAALSQSTADEPITLILSKQGWLRSRVGHSIDLSQTVFKEGDELLQAVEGRSIWPVVLLDTNGRAYTIDAANIPGGRGDGIPVGSLVDLTNGATMVAMLSASIDQHYVLANDQGYGFIVPFKELISRTKLGKSVMNMDITAKLLPPLAVATPWLAANSSIQLIAAASNNQVLALTLTELKIMSKGRGLQIMSLSDNARLNFLVVGDFSTCCIENRGKRGGLYREIVEIASIHHKRGHKGKKLALAGMITAISTSLTSKD